MNPHSIPQLLKMPVLDQVDCGWNNIKRVPEIMFEDWSIPFPPNAGQDWIRWRQR